MSSIQRRIKSNYACHKETLLCISCAWIVKWMVIKIFEFKLILIVSFFFIVESLLSWSFRWRYVHLCGNVFLVCMFWHDLFVIFNSFTHYDSCKIVAQVLEALVAAFPTSVTTRDEKGRIPMHFLQMPGRGRVHSMDTWRILSSWVRIKFCLFMA